MKANPPKNAEFFVEFRKKVKKRKKIGLALSIIVAVITTLALVRPAISASAEYQCGFEVHTHTEACNTLDYYCTTIEHTHIDSCYEEREIIASGTCGDNAEWTFDGYTLRITGEGAMTQFANGNAVPWKDYKSQVTKVVIDDGITVIGQFSFLDCTNLLEANIPSSATAIGNQAFNKCKNLSKIILPEGVTSIGTYTFGTTSLTEITLPSTLTSVGTSSFQYTNTLTEIKFNGESANYTAEDGVLYNKDKTTLIIYPASNPRTEYTIPDTVTTIEPYSFQNGKTLKKLIIPNSVSNIGGVAFESNTGIEIVEFEEGSTIEKINDRVFLGCSSLKSINLPSTITEIGGYAFSGCKSLTDFTLPENLKILGGAALNGCSSLENIEIPETLTSISASAFKGCALINEIVIPASVTTIEAQAFSGLTSLEKVTFEEGSQLTAIKDYAFSGCTALKEIIIPKSVTTLGTKVFQSCSTLERVEFEEGSNVTAIPDYAFYLCKALQTIELPDTVTSIGLSAFQECSALTNVDWSANITVIGEKAFYKCTALKEVTIPKSVVTIAKEAFSTSGLAKIDFEEGIAITSFGSSAFGYTNITEFTYPKSIINAGGIRNCSNLTTIKFEEGSQAKIIEGFGIYANNNLVEVILPEGMEDIGSNALQNNVNLRSLVLPETIRLLDQYSLAKLKEVTFTAECEKVNTTAFSDVLEKVIIGKGVKKINSTMTYAMGMAETIIFEGPNYLEMEGLSNLSASPLRDLPDGDYFVDENGALYLIEDGKAKFVYCPDGIESYTVPATLPVVDGVGGYPVTAVGYEALLNAKTLNSLEFESPQTITDIEDLAMANCLTLTKVNGITDANSVKSIFTSAQIGFNVFFNTGLANNSDAVEKGPYIDIETEYGLMINLYMPKNDKTESGAYYTGETANASISISPPKETLSQDYVTRVYFQFSDADGATAYLLSDNNKYESSTEIYYFKYAKTDHPNIYYFEFPKLKEGDTVTINSTLSYPSPSSDGGNLIIWAVPLLKSESEALGDKVINPTEYLSVDWITKRESFTVDKANYSTPRFKGSGTAENFAYLQNLQYNINSKPDNTLGNIGNVGKDYLKMVEYTDTLILPEGMAWRSEVLEAIAENNYYTNPERKQVFVDIDGEAVKVLQISKASATPIELTVTGNMLAVTWSHENTTNTEMTAANMSPNITFGDNVLVVTNPQADDVYTLKNQVEQTLYYNHSEPHTASTYVERDVTVPKSDFSFKKTGNSNLLNGRTNYAGYRDYFTLLLENVGVSPLKVFDTITDALPKQFYVSYNDMASILQDAKERGTTASFEIKNAVLCSDTVTKMVTGTDGGIYTTENSTTGVNADLTTPHNDDSVATEIATVLLEQVEGSTKVKLSVDGEYKGEFDTPQQALDSVGYLIVADTQYYIRWNISDILLYGGQIEDFVIYVTVKDAFMIEEQDTKLYAKELARSNTTQNRAEITYFDSTGNLAERTSQVSLGKSTTATSLENSSSVGGAKLEDGGAVSLGDVITNNITITNGNKDNFFANRDCVPLIEHMQGAQVLMVSKKDNPSLEEYGLEVTTIELEEYYLLTKPGTYENVYVGGLLADSVTVAEKTDGFDTTVYWYLVEDDIADKFELEYFTKAYARDDMVGTNFKFGGYLWLGDHQSHRFYYRNSSGGANSVGFHKYIVVEKGATPKEDICTDYSPVSEGQTVLYRLQLSSSSNVGIAVSGNSLIDILPASLHNFWDPSDIEVIYDEGITVTNGDHWYITSQSPDGIERENRQYLRWSDDCIIRAEREAYIYVKLTFPKTTEWDEYLTEYNLERIDNTFMVDNFKESVYHYLEMPTEAVLQKGVYETGILNANKLYPNDEVDSNFYYHNGNSQYQNYVKYYAVLYNSGNGNLYVNELQDILPKGVVLVGLNAKESKPPTVDDAYNSDVNYVDYSLGYSRTQLSDGRYKYTYNFTTKSDSANSIKYDSYERKYYLAPGEALVINYTCKITSDFDITGETLTNSIAMPVYDALNRSIELSNNKYVVINGANNENNITENKGSRGFISQEEALSEGYTGKASKWLSSKVSQTREKSVVPGIVKEIDKITKNHGGTSESMVAEPYDIITWKLTLSNMSNGLLHDYSVIEVMQPPYGFTGDVKIEFDYLPDDPGKVVRSYNLFTIEGRTAENDGYNITANTKYVLRVNAEPITVKVGNSELSNREILLSLTKEEGSEQEILQIRFKDEAFNLLPHTKAYIYIDTKNIQSSVQNKIFYNNAYIVPQEKIDEESVTHGYVQDIIIGDTEKVSVTTAAPVTVAAGYATTSNKTVTQVGDSSNTITSETKPEYIVLSNHTDLFDYSLVVNNITDRAMEKLVIIDNLPEKGDHSTFVKSQPRHSEFKVSLANDPNFRISVIDNNGETLLSSSQYELQFTTVTDFTEDDWKGLTTTTDWNATPQEARAFRVVLRDSVDGIIPPNATLKITFTAKVDGDASHGQIAWNGFGYHYKLIGFEPEFESAPFEVGVKIPEVPNMQKELSKEFGTLELAEKDEVFRFIIYEGDALSLAPDYSQDELAQALINADRKATLVELKVEKGELLSEKKHLKDLFCYIWQDGEWVKTSEEWKWKSGDGYTVTELPLNEDSYYEFASINNIAVNEYTFEYDNDISQAIKAVNNNIKWSVLLNKIGSKDYEALGGVTFGLYSPYSYDMITDEEYNNLAITPQKTITVNDKTYYLSRVETTDANGNINWDELFRKEYYLVELAVPKGLLLDDTPIEINYEKYAVSNEALVVINTTEYELPKTGGRGTHPALVGLVMVVCAGIPLYIMHKRKRKRVLRE